MKKAALTLLAVLGALGLSLGAWAVLESHSLPDIERLADKPALARQFHLSRWTPYAEFSKPLLWAILTSEDDEFFAHEGVDASELAHSLLVDLRHLSFRRGGSTITQQVAKCALLTKEKTLRRKLRELLLARRIEERFTKRQILEIYLNIVETGPEIYGVEAGAWLYFSKPPSLLNAKEGAFLAVLLPNPRKRAAMADKGELSRPAKRKIRLILERMARAGRITEAELSVELARPLPFEKPASAPLLQTPQPL